MNITGTIAKGLEEKRKKSVSPSHGDKNMAQPELILSDTSVCKNVEDEMKSRHTYI